MKNLWLILLAVLLFFLGYQNRYRVMNKMLGIGVIRRFVVARTMSVPQIRERLMQSLI
ncbi:hypothetical protein [Bacillus taeanensis]|uniref:hypothetical protein n=1 Tax=Bacillus taeanensis TaxID=273032 RepID=UPI0015F0AE7B|nr:hypothetical protein [Bacillus taeanensis]